MGTSIFVLFAAMVLVGAVWVVTLRNLLRAALSLGLVLLGIAGLFLLLRAEFLAFVQILIYVGAILTLVVFAIMLTSRLHSSPSKFASSLQQIPAAIVSAALFALLGSSTCSVSWPAIQAAEPVELSSLGQQLVTKLVLPFEVISVVFVAVIIGSIALARPYANGEAPDGKAGNHNS